jgi:hypothetical protein
MVQDTPPYIDLVVSNLVDEFITGVDFLSHEKAVSLQYRNTTHQWLKQLGAAEAPGIGTPGIRAPGREA